MLPNVLGARRAQARRALRTQFARRAEESRWFGRLLVALATACASLASSGCTMGDGGAAATAACCGGLGTCVPSALVPANAVSQLSPAGCGDSLLCAPNELLMGSAHFATCTSLDEAEGRCVPSCLPAVASEPDLPLAGCAAGHVCSPCFNPFDGGTTGACAIGNDQPDAAPVLFPSCCGDLGRCVPTGAVPNDEQSNLGPDVCTNAGDLCVPLTLSAPNSIPSSCFVSSTGAEGRCLPGCLPEVASRIGQLATDGCDPSSFCTPCYDPVDGTSTGACSIGTDAPKLPKVVFPSCCDSEGSCVPESFVSASEMAQLPSSGCAQSGTVCAPTDFAKDPSLVPPACTVSSTGAEGRCLTTCLPEVARRANSLSQDSCAADHLCVPCDDPVDGTTTGACTINGDAPTQPPYEFATCCSGVGRCVPQSLVAMDQSHLAADTCGVANLCVPTAFAEDPDSVPPTCTVSSIGAEGRCLPACLPDVAPHVNSLSEDGCAASNLCVPCYDPVDGTATGACSLNTDHPTEPPTQFASCCSGGGRCVPASDVPAADLSHFGADTCPSVGATVCVPTAFVTDPKTVPEPCTVSANGAVGRCLPSCLPGVQSSKAYLKADGCPDSYLCSPCADPVTGEATGACSFPGDPYGSGSSPPPLCCGALGTCLPQTYVEESGATSGDIAELQTGSCKTPQDLCVPTNVAADPTHYVAPKCTVSATQAEGRCLPNCLNGLCSTALKQDGCDSAYLCAPCFDPVSGASTGACHIGGDPGPSSVPPAPAQCCGGVGTCVTAGLVDAKDRSQLGADTCAAGALCAPTTMVTAADECQSYTFPACVAAASGGEGRCLPGCLPNVAKVRSGLTQATCPNLDLCAPCFDPVTGAATGACSIGSDAPHDATPTLFPTCCGGQGRCVPASYVGASLTSELGKDTCASSASLCAPAELIDPPGTPPPTCTTSLNEAEGRCLPSCLPSVKSRAADLAQDGCASAQSCVPCYDPSTGAATGACTTGTDKPSQPARGLVSCCGGAGLCVPTATVPAGFQSNLVTDTCTAEEPVSCVPAPAATDPTGFTLPVCHDSATTAEGRCLPSCLPTVAAQATRLRQSGCPAAELCVPCYDPVSGAATGACSTAPGDEPTSPAVVFAKCCNESGTSLGLCVPPSLIPATDPTPPQETCPANFVCAPRADVVDPATLPTACSASLTIPVGGGSSGGAGSGECVLTCLVPPIALPFVNQDDCDSNSKCLPCSSVSGGSCP